MTAKKAIIIGLLTASIVGLISFGIKTKTFKPKTMQTSAEDILPISKNWLMNETISLNYEAQTEFVGEFRAQNEAYNYKSMRVDHLASTPPRRDLMYKYLSGNSYYTNYAYVTTTHWLSGTSSTIQRRIVKYTNDPVGSTLTFLQTNAKPIYNNNVILQSGPCINSIRKSNVILEDYTTAGTIINRDGIIQIYIDSGCTEFKINETNYTSNMSGTLNITNDNIVIKTKGNETGTIANVFTINYFHTLPDIEPTPIPDADSKVVEVLDITDLMFTILTMPFSFISQAFNLTLWEGTPYQFNFSNFILSLIAIATIIFIIKLFTSGFSVMGNYTGKIQGSRLNKQKSKPKPEKPKPETTKKE